MFTNKGEQIHRGAFSCDIVIIVTGFVDLILDSKKHKLELANDYVKAYTAIYYRHQRFLPFKINKQENLLLKINLDLIQVYPSINFILRKLKLFALLKYGLHLCENLRHAPSLPYG